MRSSTCRGGTFRAAACVLAITLCSAAAAQAQNSDEMQSYLVSINRLYEELEYERALDQIASARRLVRGREDDVTLLLYEGVILADLGKWEQSSAAFKSALFLNPDAKLPVRVSPKVTKHFEEARIQVRKQLAPVLAKREEERKQAEAEKQRLEKERQESERMARNQAGEGQGAEVSPRESEPAGRSGLRSRALIPALAGGVLLVGGGISYGLAKGEQSRLNSNDPGIATRPDVDASISRGKTYQTVGFTLMGAGVVGLGIATGLFVLGEPAKPTVLGVSTDGTSAFIFGRWP